MPETNRVYRLAHRPEGTPTHDAFLGLFEGANIGKQLVQVGERGVRQ